jgi:hypothetical protein
MPLSRSDVVEEEGDIGILVKHLCDNLSEDLIGDRKREQGRSGRDTRRAVVASRERCVLRERR